MNPEGSDNNSSACCSLQEEKKVTTTIPRYVLGFPSIVRYASQDGSADTQYILCYLSSNEGEPFTGEEEIKYLGRDMMDICNDK